MQRVLENLPATAARLEDGAHDMLDPATGKFGWRTGLSNGVTGTPSLDGAGVLVVGTYDISATRNAIYAVSAATGKILRTLDQGSYDFAQSAFSGGLLVMASLTGLYCWHD